MKLAKIEIRTRNIKDAPNIPTLGIAQHLFIIYTNSNQQETILRGGPKNDKMFFGDIEIIKLPYQQIINGQEFSDWVINAPSITIATGTDEEMQALVDKMWAKAQEINLGNYDYKLPTFGVPDKILNQLLNSNVIHLSGALDKDLRKGIKSEDYFSFSHVQNSNTAVRVMVEAAGLKLELPKHHDGTQIWVPGIESHEFKHTVIDGLLTKLKQEFSASNIKYIDLKLENQYDPLNFMGSVLEFAVADDAQKLKIIINIIKMLQAFSHKKAELNQPKIDVSESIKNKEHLDSKNLNICTEKLCKSELYDALLQNNKEAFLQALEKGANPNSGFLWKSTGIHTVPINLAANKGEKFYVEKLIEYGAEVNANKMCEIDHATKGTSIFAAASKGFFNITSILLNAGAIPDYFPYSSHNNCIDSNNTPLYEVITKKYYDIAKLLLEYGANPDLGTILGFSTYKNNKEFTYYHETPLYHAIQKKDAIATEMLLTYGACVEDGLYEVYNYKSDIRTHSAYDLAQRSSSPIIKELIEYFPCNDFTHNNLDEAYGALHSLVGL